MSHDDDAGHGHPTDLRYGAGCAVWGLAGVGAMCALAAGALVMELGLRNMAGLEASMKFAALAVIAFGVLAWLTIRR